MTAPFIVTLWDIAAADRGRDTVRASISDARDVGVSSYANEGGEMFFTLPWNHPQITECQPWLRHYEVKRYNARTGDYDVVGVGLLDDYESTMDEVVVYGQDYLGLFNQSISASNTSYNNTLIGTIIAAQLSAAINQTIGTTGVKSVTKFLTLGSIDATSLTTTVLTSYQPRLDFIRQVVDIYQQDSSVRPIVSVSRSAPFTVSFTANQGVDQSDIRLDLGALLNDFRYSPGFKDFGTYINAVGQKREGATILYSTQSYASAATYGIIQKPTLFLNVIDQTALDNKAKRAARNLGTIGKQFAPALRVGQIGPWQWGELADSLPVVIDRGITQVNGLYTVWGQEWIGKSDGSEDLFLSILPKET